MDVQAQTLKLINSLKVSGQFKADLAQELKTQGVTTELIKKISEVIDQSEEAFLEQAKIDMKNFQAGLEAAKAELAKLKAEKKLAGKEAEAQALEAIRKQIQ